MLPRGSVGSSRGIYCFSTLFPPFDFSLPLRQRPLAGETHMVRSLAVARLSTTRAESIGGAVILGGGGPHFPTFFRPAGRVLLGRPYV